MMGSSRIVKVEKIASSNVLCLFIRRQGVVALFVAGEMVRAIACESRR